MEQTGNIEDKPLAFRVDPACEKLGISRTTLYDEIRAGRIKAVKCGKRTLIPVSSAMDWLNNLPAKAA